MNEKAKALLDHLCWEFGHEDGPEYYEFVHYYETQKLDEITPEFSIKLDGEFTIRQLRKIADVLEQATAYERSVEHLFYPQADLQEIAQACSNWEKAPDGGWIRYCPFCGMQLPEHLQGEIRWSAHQKRAT